MTFLYDHEKHQMYFDNLQTPDGERIYIDNDAYDAFVEAEADMKRRPEYYQDLAEQARKGAEEVLAMMEPLFQRHQAAQYDRAMEVLDETGDQD